MSRPPQHSLGLSTISERSVPQRGTCGSRYSQDTLIVRSESEETLVDTNNMPSTSNGEGAIERKTSFGIGGAGNIRKLSRSLMFNVPC